MRLVSIVRGIALGACCSTMLAACSRPLPEPDSPAAMLYTARCGGCHAPHQPSLMTPTMWKYQFERMDQKHRAAGTQMPTPAEHDQILDYLTRHAAH